MDEFYCEQEIGSGYGNECHAEFVPSSRHEEIQKEGERKGESDSKVNKGQEAQDFHDKKSGTVETSRRSQRERKQPDWFSYSSMAEFAYSAVVDMPLTFDESSDKKKWRVSMDEEINAHNRNKTLKLVSRPIEVPIIDNK